MYVCICNAICDKTVGQAISDGHSEPDSVYAACGVKPQCGKCAETIEEMIWNHRLSQNTPAAE